MQLEIIDTGVLAYPDAWEMQKAYFQATLAQKRAGLPTQNRLLFCEHPPVFTLGKSAQDANLLVTPAQLAAEGIALYRIERGGDITFHGLGQCVGYPILDLDTYGIGIRRYVWQIEEAIIRLLADFGILAERIEGASGVWVGKVRKICALGIKCSSGITMHGFALNVHTDLHYFGYMNPCGITDKAVTSMAQEVGKDVTMVEVKMRLAYHFREVFGETNAAS